MVALLLAVMLLPVVPAQQTAEATSIGLAFKIGAGNSDGGDTIAADASGNVYIAGTFTETVDFDPIVGSTNRTAFGSGDMWVAKYTPSGALAWVRTFGTAGSDTVSRLVIDATGFYIVGDFFSTINVGPGDLTPIGRATSISSSSP